MQTPNTLQSPSKRREAFLDVLRVISALTVVVFHVLESASTTDSTVTAQQRLNTQAVSAMLIWPVSVFFMITGYLWLKREKACTYSKMAKNLLRFTLVLLTFGFGYALLERLFDAKALTPALLWLSFRDVLTGSLWDHMWYLYSAIGVYLFLPVIKPFFDTQSTKTIALLTGLTFVFTVLVPAAGEQWGYQLPIDFPMAAPSYYLCMGGLLSRLRISQRVAWSMVPVLGLCCLGQCFGVLDILPLEKAAPVLTCLSATAVFIVAQGLCDRTQPGKWLTALSGCAFGIYLIHPLFINLLMKLLHVYPLRFCPVLSIPLTSLGVILTTFGTTWLLRKVPWIRKYLL